MSNWPNLHSKNCLNNKHVKFMQDDSIIVSPFNFHDLNKDDKECGLVSV